MKKIIVLVLVLLSTCAIAQQPADAATADDVSQLFEIMHQRQQMEAMKGIIAQQVASMTNDTLTDPKNTWTPEQKELFRQYTQDSIKKMFESMPFDEMMKSMYPVYQRHFTHDDMQQMIAFYKTPVGQKFITQIPLITGEAMQLAMPVAQKWMASQMEQMKKDSEEFSKKMDAAGKRSDEAPKK